MKPKTKKQNEINDVLSSLTTITSLINVMSIVITIVLFFRGIIANELWCLYVLIPLYFINKYLFNVATRADKLRTDLE
jgi:hypothetical protein